MKKKPAISFGEGKVVVHASPQELKGMLDWWEQSVAQDDEDEQERMWDLADRARAKAANAIVHPTTSLEEREISVPQPT